MSNVKTWLEKSTAVLETAGISTARLDCLVLLEDATCKDRGWLLAHPDYTFKATTLKDLDQLVKRRVEHEPLAYIRNKTEFYAREFYIDHRVLEPRPESETMIELLRSSPLLPRHAELVSASQKSQREILKQVQDDDVVIVDLGTGSGALAITIKLEFPASTVIATDIDAGCLEVAKKNTQTLGADITFLQGDLLEPLKTSHSRLDAILANLPYVPDDHEINAAAMKEPRLAIFGGPDGLDLYRKMFLQLKELDQKPQFILTESMPPQHGALAKIAMSAGYKLQKTDDFIQVFTSLSS